MYLNFLLRENILTLIPIKMNRVKGVRSFAISNKAYSVEIGYITLPTNVDRDSYVETCCRTSTVSVYIERNGSVSHNCIVSRQVFQDLIFPESNDVLGSPVILISSPFFETYFVIATVPALDEITGFAEHIYSKKIFDGDGSFDISASLADGTALISIFGSGKRKLRINVVGDESSVELSTNGNVDLTANGNVHVKSFDSVVSEVVDVDNDKATKTTVTASNISIETPDSLTISVTDGEKSTNIDMNPSGILVKSGESEARVTQQGITLNKSDSGLKNTLKQLIGAIKKLTVTTGTGPSGTPINIAEFEAIENDLENYLEN